MHNKLLKLFTCGRTYPRDQVKDGFEQQEEDLSHVSSSLSSANQTLLERFAGLQIPISQIRLALDGVTQAHPIHIDEYSYVYKAELNSFDTETAALATEGENDGELQKKPVIVRICHNMGIESFHDELEMLNGCKHPNLLSLAGFCNEMILVFECSFKETLHNCLKTTNLTWEQQISICLDIAKGLNYIYKEGKSSMIRQGIQSTNVVLDDNGTAKIANFRLSDYDPFWMPRDGRPGLFFKEYRTPMRSDAEDKTLIQQGESSVVDAVYSLGGILLEILTGGRSKDPNYMAKNLNGPASLKEKADPRIVREAHECSYDGHHEASLDIFCRIVYRCLAEKPSKRPSLEYVISSLEKALQSQVQGYLTIPLKDIRLATRNFHEDCLIGHGGYGNVYQAKLNGFVTGSYFAEKLGSKDKLGNMPYNVAIKRIHRTVDKGEKGYFVELDVLRRCEHPNIVSLLGYSVDDKQMLLEYELAPKGSLDNCLKSTVNNFDLTWTQRLRICIGIARGLKYLHTNMENKPEILHGDMKSANILLGENLEAKITDFGLSRMLQENQGDSTILTRNIAGTNVYWDPYYAANGILKKESDIYSLGVVLFEIFSGTVAYDSKYIGDLNGLAAFARTDFDQGKLKETLGSKLMQGATPPDNDSLDVFLRMAYNCLVKKQDKRPTIKLVVKELEKALYIQLKTDPLKFPFEHIRSGVENFSDDNCIGRTVYGTLYKGKVQYNDIHIKVVVKQFYKDKDLVNIKFPWEEGFLTEFDVLSKYRQENIIGLVGYYKEKNERIIVYEHASKGSLDRHLKDASLSWTQRLNICLDIAKGLKFLHGGDAGQDVVIHGDLRSCHILLTKDWKAKICGFERASTHPSSGHSDQMFLETQFLTKESDIHSFGLILLEVLCGRVAYPNDLRDSSQYLEVVVKRHIQEAPLTEIVFRGIKEEIGQKSLATFGPIAFRCLADKIEERPTASTLVLELQSALKDQEAHELKEAELNPNSKLSNIRLSLKAKEDICNIIFKGVLLEHDKEDIIRVLQKSS